MRPVRLGILILVAFAVLAEGAVEPWSQAALEAGAAVLFLLWGFMCLQARRIVVRWNWIYLPLLGLAGVALMQEILGLTLYPYATKVELLKGTAYLILCFLAAEAFPTAGKRQQLAWMLVALTFLVSLFGILQYFTFNGKLYWFRPLPPGATAPFGSYVNANHFAGFAEMTMPFGIAMALSGAIQREKLALISLCAVLPLAALVLCGSRGGLASCFAELALLGFLVGRRGGGKKLLLTAASLGLAACLLVLWLGPGRIITRLSTLSPEGISDDRRVSLFNDTWNIFLNHRWTGTGLGTLQTAYPGYATFYDGLIVDHTHNDYLELLADTGIIGGLCGLGFLAILLTQARNNLRVAVTPMARSFYVGASSACVGLLAHSFVDFNLHIPANALLFLLLASLLALPAERSIRSGTDRPAIPARTKYS
jgi:O-antigen ligase